MDDSFLALSLSLFLFFLGLFFGLFLVRNGAIVRLCVSAGRCRRRRRRRRRFFEPKKKSPSFSRWFIYLFFKSRISFSFLVSEIVNYYLLIITLKGLEFNDFNEFTRC